MVVVVVVVVVVVFVRCSRSEECMSTTCYD